ncbi:MAG: DUF4012 domain-containing protein [Candidatus Uhrbacteria bacterium]|nr:DUF4012 domain-containing protein [Candidatus Uhrbacteria bacterium]
MSQSDKKQRNQPQTTIDPQTFQVLSAVNAVQFFAVLIRGVIVSGEVSVLAFGRIGIYILSAIFFVLHHFALGIGFMLGGVFRLLDRIAYGVAYAISWTLVSVVWLFCVAVKLLLWRVWGTIVFVCYRIPKFLVVSLYRTIAFVIRSIASVFDRCITALALVPSAILDGVSQTRESFSMPTGGLKRMATFVGIALLFILPFPAIHSFQFLNDVRADTERVSIEGLTLLMEGKEALIHGEFEKAAPIFAKSEDQFTQAQKTISIVPDGVREAARFVPGPGQKIGDGERLILIGKNVAHAGVIATDIAIKFSQNSADPQALFLTISKELEKVDDVFRALKDADTLASQINPKNIPDDYRSRFDSLTAQLHSLIAAANQILPSRDVLLRMTGSGVKRRYLIVFQNNTELRPTGGFIGSYALADVLNGALVNVEIPGGGSYDLKGSLSVRVQSPFPLHVINPSWQFQDSNWFPDFPTSAKKMIWFYEKSGGPTVDGVIALNASFFQNILGIIGSVDMPSYGKSLTPDNFMLETQKAVELEYDKQENRPKQFIADLFPKTLEKMGTMPPEKRSEFLSEVIASCLSRDIQMYMRDEQEEGVLRQFGIAGEMRASPLDYFSVIQANVGGGKGEGVIDEDIERKTVFKSDGNIEVRVTIHRKHRGKIGDPFGGTRNISYIRMYFPKGTRSMSAAGFSVPDQSLFKPSPEGYTSDETLREIEGIPALDPATGMIATTEYGKSVFAHWMTLEPQQESIAEAVFLLPFTLLDIPRNREGNYLYSLLVQRQSGSTTKAFTSIFQSEEGVTFSASTPQDSLLKKNELTRISDPFLHDEVVGLTLHQ